MEHGIPHLLLQPPLDRFPFLLTNLELLIEAFDGHERVLYRSLHGDPELALLLTKLEGDQQNQRRLSRFRIRFSSLLQEVFNTPVSQVPKEKGALNSGFTLFSDLIIFD
jgi:hypothetical protein